jgi:hypothetical protein
MQVTPIAITQNIFSMPSMREIRGITVELTRRRAFNQASPDQLSYETRSRRSRPTICSIASRQSASRIAKKCGRKNADRAASNPTIQNVEAPCTKRRSEHRTVEKRPTKPSGTTKQNAYPDSIDCPCVERQERECNSR